MKVKFYVNAEKPAARAAARELTARAAALGLAVAARGGSDAVIALGGDGTILRAVHDCAGVPVLGFNLGGLGYLSSVGREDFETALRMLAAGRFTVSERTMLEVRKVGTRRRKLALNDIVLMRELSGHAAVLDLEVDGRPATRYMADGLVLGYRVGAKLLYADTLQYHPTGAAYPEQIFGALVTEKVRSLGAKLVNANGEVFMHPLETRDVSAASIIRECNARGNGVKTADGVGVWLDTPMIEMKGGEGTILARIPAMYRMFEKYGIDIRKEPILVYPTLHYQNGGLDITPDGMTGVENLYAAGEVVGGIHGRNRLMGNSLLDVIVFGRNAGKYASEKSKSVEVGALTLEHVGKFAEEAKAAGIESEVQSPKLLPVYSHGNPDFVKKSF